MIFIELILENFGPYLGRQVIDLRPEKDSKSYPIILIGGMNGGGKTTFMDAIRLALYGPRAQCSTRGNLSYSDFLTQSVNRQTPPTEMTQIELDFEVIQDDQLTKFKVVRKWKKEPKDGKDILGILTCNDFQTDWWPDKALANTWDDYIENLIPLGISNLFLFDGEQVKELAEMETPPLTVVEAIQSLLGLELSERLSQDLEILVNRKCKEIISPKDLANLEQIEEKLAIEKDKFDIVSQELVRLNDEFKVAISKYEDAQNKFIYEGGKIAQERSQLDQENKHLLNQSEKIREIMRDLAADVLPLSLIYPLLEQAKIQAEKEHSQQSVKITIDVIKNRDQKLLNYLTESSLFNPEIIAEIQKFLETENAVFEQQIFDDEKIWLKAEPEIIEQLNSLLNYQLKSVQKQGQEKYEELKELEKEIDFLERQIVKSASPELYQQLEKNLKDAQTKMNEIEVERQLVKRNYDELDQTIKQIKKELATFAEEEIKQRSNQHIIQASSKVQETLKVFREKLTLKKLSKLENEVTKCFRYLLHKSDLVNKVTIDRNSYRLALYDPQGAFLPKNRLSAGEKQLLAIAFLWGLALVSGQKLPIAIDTPLGRLDSEHRQNLVDRYFPAASHQVILLSTDTEITQVEYARLQEQETIAREYLLKYDPIASQTLVQPGYFWP